MNTIKMPGFSAERSLQATHGRYRGRWSVALKPGAVIPAIPRCENCDYILGNCEANGWKPTAACNACASGRCSSGEENPGGRCWYEPFSGRIICDL